jgi:hypothetical protein
MDAPRRREDERRTGPAGVDETRLLAGLRRTPRERLDHAVQLWRAMRRFRGARRVGPLLPN